MTQIEKYDRAWQHFKSIADQRISSFNHYLIALGVLLTAFTAISRGPHGQMILIVLSALNILTPLSFWAIDTRVCRLLKNLKDVLFSIEADGWPDDFKPFHRDKEEQGLWKNRLRSYTPVFWGMFSIHVVAGLALLGYSLFFRASQDSPKPQAQRQELQLDLKAQGVTQTVTVSDPSDLKLHLQPATKK
jgi:hypothetical protein